MITQKLNNRGSVALSSSMLKSKGIDRVESAGHPFGNYSKIVVDGIEMSPNRRGINILVLKSDGQRIATHFDTFATEKMYEGIWLCLIHI